MGKWRRRKVPESLASQPPAHTGGLQRSSGAEDSPRGPDSTNPPPSQGRQALKSSSPPPVPLTMTFILTLIPGVPLALFACGLSLG